MRGRDARKDYRVEHDRPPVAAVEGRLQCFLGRNTQELQQQPVALRYQQHHGGGSRRVRPIISLVESLDRDYYLGRSRPLGYLWYRRGIPGELREVHLVDPSRRALVAKERSTRDSPCRGKREGLELLRNGRRLPRGEYPGRQWPDRV